MTRRGSLVLAFVLVFSAGTAKAFLAPVAGLAALYYTAFSGTVATWLAVAAGIGSTLYAIGIADPNTGQNVAVIPIHPDYPQPVPAGWTAGVLGADPVPPSTAGSPVACYGGGSTGVSPCVASATAACNTWLSGCQGGFCGGAYVLTSTSGGLCHYTYGANNSLSGSGSYVTTFTCPVGYVVSGSNCVISVPTSVPFLSDGICGLKFSAGTMSYNSRDPDCTGASPTLTVNTPGTQVTAQTPTAKITVVVNADGSVTTTTWLADPNNTAQTIQTAVTTSPPVSGTPNKIVSAQQSSINGTGAAAQAVAAPTPTATPNTQTPQNIQFPTDYDREATQQAVLTSLGTSNTNTAQLHTDQQQLHTDLTSTTALPPNLGTSKTETDLEGLLPTSGFSSLLSWQLPARTVSCPTWGFDLTSYQPGWSWTMNAQCTLASTQAATVSAVMVLVWTFIALFLVLSA